MAKKPTKKSRDSFQDVLMYASIAFIIAVTSFLIYRANITKKFNEMRLQAYTYSLRPKTASLMLNERDRSGQSGKASLKEVDGKVVVSIFTEGGPSGVRQVAHIHAGTCENLGEIAYPLTSLYNGESETALEINMDQLFSGQQMALNVHKSSLQTSGSNSCANLPLDY